jgi:hypothetical protein
MRRLSIALASVVDLPSPVGTREALKALMLNSNALRCLPGLVTCGLLALPPTAWSLPVDLGTAGSFSVLSGTTVTNTGATVLSGDVGVSPGSAVTGFGSVTGTYTTHLADGAALQAKSDLTTAYNYAAALSFTQNLTGQDLGGLTLLAGTYFFSSSAQLTGTVILDAQGDPNAQFVFQIGSTLTTASNSFVVSTNTGSQDPLCNVFWQVGSSATLGTGTSFEGHILALTSITLNTGATIIGGSALARNGAVALDSNVIDTSTCNERSVPDGGYTFLMLGGGFGCLLVLRRSLRRRYFE